MRRTVRVFAFLAACILLFAAAVFPTGAADEENLILHYDFEGDTPEERLSDKAGNSAENLTPVGENIEIADGVAYIPGTVSTYLQAVTDGTGDFSEQKGAYTILIRFRTLDGENKDWTDLFQLPGLCQGILTTKTELQVRACGYWKNKVFLDYASGWNTVAVVVDFENAEIAAGFAGDAMSPTGFEKNGDFTSGMTLTLGKLQGSDPAAKWNMDIEIDDFRVYDAALTQEQIQEIQVGYCMRAVADGITVTASTEGLAKAAVIRELERQLNCSPVAVALTDVVFTPGESLAATVNYTVGETTLRQENARFGVRTPEASYIGYQVSGALTEGSTFSIRLIGSVASLAYEGAGLEITSLAKGKTWSTQNTGVVYSTLLGQTEDDGIVEYKAPDGSYFTAYTLANIPQDTADTFTVRAFVTVNGERVYGDTFELTFDGYASLTGTDEGGISS